MKCSWHFIFADGEQILYSMKSKASIDGHPIHMMLMHFPIGFFSGTLLLDIISIILHNSSVWNVSGYLLVAGVIMALATAIPGAIDFFYTVPPASSAKKRAIMHAVLNLITVGIFACSFFIRQRTAQITIVGLELAGMALMAIAGYLGGTLVVRNQIGIYNRYADKGKWKEEYIKDAALNQPVGNVDELKPGQLKLLHINNKRIIIANTGNGFVAFDDRCPHKGGSLAGGMLICDTIQCPWHGSQFDVRTGKVKAGPAEEQIATYPLTIENNKIFIQIN